MKVVAVVVLLCLLCGCAPTLDYYWDKPGGYNQQEWRETYVYCHARAGYAGSSPDHYLAAVVVGVARQGRFDDCMISQGWINTPEECLSDYDEVRKGRYNLCDDE